jgi:hypothetical protein
MFSRSTFFAAVAATGIGALVAFTPGTAHAVILTDCGNVDLDANTTCSLAATGDCSAQCTAPNFQLQCSADLEASCSGQCNASASASCDISSCEASCMGGCSSGSFSCEGSCDTDCNGNCMAHCSSNGDESQCEASCKETCDSTCSGSCSGQPPMCTPVTCQAACQGSCTAQANIDCQVSCQAMGSVNCEAMYTGGCTTSCEGGVALFCNGQYVNVTNLQACEAELVSLLNINVSASAECNGNTCSSQAAASCGQIAPGSVPMSEGFFAVGLGAGIVGAIRRRVRKAKASKA